MQLPKLNVLLRATVALCVALVTVPPVLGQPSGDPLVREAQTLLAEQDYSPGPVDGILGPRTLSAILRFQIDHGLPPTRKLDDATLETLRTAEANRQGGPDSEKPVAGPVAASPPAVSNESPSTQAESETIGTDDARDAGLFESSEAEVIQDQTAASSEKNSNQALATMPLPEPEMPAAQSLAQGEPLAAADAGEEQTQGTSPESSFDPLAWFESLSDYLPSEFNLSDFNIENALFIGLLVFAVVAVIAAIYTSLRGREPKEQDQRAEAEEETVLARSSEEELEATMIAPVEPTVTAPPQVTEPRPTETTGTSPTELMISDTEAASPEEVTRAVRAELFAEAEPEPRTQKAEPDAWLRDEQPQEDPLADLNIHLAFERFDQAEALVKDAIERYPQRHEYLLRLLEVYTAAKNPLAFEFYAKALRDAVGDKSPLMRSALRWWDTISPERPLFEAPLTEETRRV